MDILSSKLSLSFIFDSDDLFNAFHVVVLLSPFKLCKTSSFSSSSFSIIFESLALLLILGLCKARES